MKAPKHRLNPKLWQTLTPREKEVALALAQGHDRQAVSRHFQFDVKTLDSHRLNILRKLRLKNTAMLTRYAIRHGHMDTDGNDLAAPC